MGDGIVRKSRGAQPKGRVVVPLEGGGFLALPKPKPKSRSELSRAVVKLRKKRGENSVPEPELDDVGKMTQDVSIVHSGRTKHRWDEAKDFYLNHTEDITLAEVADMFAIPRDQMYNRNQKERWQYLRAQHQAQLLRERRKKRQFENMVAAEEFDASSLSIGKLGQGLVVGRLVQISEVFAADRERYARAIELVRQGIKVPREELYGAVRAAELMELAKAAQLFQELGRKALGTDVQNIHLFGGLDGADGGDAPQASVVDELGRADPDRIAAMIDALVDLGEAGLKFDGEGNVVGFDIIDGEVVEDPVQAHLEQHPPVADPPEGGAS